MARSVSASVWLLLAAGVLGLVGACSSGPDKAELTVRGTEMAFTAPDSVAAGDYVLTFANQGSMIHEVAVRDAAGRVLRRVGAPPGATASMDLTLVPGTY